MIEEYLEMEAELNLLEKTIDGNLYFWERIRKKIYNEINQKKGERGQAHSARTSTTDDIKKGVRLLKNVFQNNPFLAGETDYLFYGHSRRKKLDDGFWWDIYCDPIVDTLEDEDYLLIESPYLTSHRTPAKTENIRYLDMITYADGVREKLNLYSGLDSEDKELLEDIENEIQSRFDVAIDLISLVERKVLNRNTSVPLYKRLLKRVNPDIAVLLVSYGKETFIEACNELQIPTVELQHGVIHTNHLGYHYPGDRTKRYFPDYLLTFGEYWNDCVNYPIEDERVIAVGYPYLEQRRKKYEDAESSNQILFISQGTIGEQLSKFAMEVNEHPDIDHDIVYKLHPGEYDRWRDEYPWLVDADFEVIDSSEPPLYELFAKSSAQIGVGSTAVFEGLCFDLETFVYDCPGSSVLASLVDEDAAELVSSADELASSLGAGKMAFDREYYFEPNAIENACQVLERLASEGSSRGLESR